MNNFPKRVATSNTADIGINYVSHIINDKIGWIFRRNPQEYDFGIDGYIDIIEPDGSVTGKSVAIQIKTGTSYFREDSHGDVVFYGELKHLNYYANLDIPVIIVLHNPETDLTIWESFDLNKIDTSEKNWKCSLSKNKTFDKSSKKDILQLVPETHNVQEFAKKQTKINNEILKSDFIWYAIPKDDILNMNTNDFINFIKRIEGNRSLARHCMQKIDISVSGYDFDKRELWEIKEVRLWFQDVYKHVDSWLYFSTKKREGAVLKLIFSCIFEQTKTTRPTTINGKILLEWDTRDIAQYMENCFNGLNKLTDDLNISRAENKRMSSELKDIFKIPNE